MRGSLRRVKEVKEVKDWNVVVRRKRHANKTENKKIKETNRNLGRKGMEDYEEEGKG